MNIARIIKALLFTPGNKGFWGPPALFEGPPGCAKSDILIGVALHCGLPVEHLKPSERGEGFFGVVPVPEGGYLTYPKPDWVKKFEKGRGLILVDEINKADPTILQPPLFGLVNDRVIGSYQLANGIRVLAAGNPVTNRTFGHDMDIALSNRMARLDWVKPTTEEWVSYHLRGGKGVDLPPIDPDVEEARVMAVWDAVYAETAALVCSFIKAHPAILYMVPKDDDPTASRAWPSFRTWELAMRALAGAKIHGLDAEEADYLLAGYVGEAAAVEFVAWRRQLDLPDCTAVLDGTVEFKHDPMRLDRTWATLNGCVAVVREDKSKAKTARVSRLWTILASLADHGADLVAEPTRILMDVGLLAPATVQTLSKMRPVFEAAGRVPGREAAA